MTLRVTDRDTQRHTVTDSDTEKCCKAGAVLYTHTGTQRHTVTHRDTQ